MGRLGQISGVLLLAAGLCLGAWGAPYYMLDWGGALVMSGAVLASAGLILILVGVVLVRMADLEDDLAEVRAAVLAMNAVAVRPEAPSEMAAMPVAAEPSPADMPPEGGHSPQQEPATDLIRMAPAAAGALAAGGLAIAAQSILGAVQREPQGASDAPDAERLPPATGLHLAELPRSARDPFDDVRDEDDSQTRTELPRAITFESDTEIAAAVADDDRMVSAAADERDTPSDSGATDDDDDEPDLLANERPLDIPPVADTLALEHADFLTAADRRELEGLFRTVEASPDLERSPTSVLAADLAGDDIAAVDAAIRALDLPEDASVRPADAPLLAATADDIASKTADVADASTTEDDFADLRADLVDMVEPAPAEPARSHGASEPAIAPSQLSATGAADPDQPEANLAEEEVAAAYTVGDSVYAMLADGRIRVTTPEGQLRFNSMDELREFMAARRDDPT